MIQSAVWYNSHMTCRMTSSFCLIQELGSEEDSGLNSLRGLSSETPPTDTPLLPPTPKHTGAV